MTLKRKDQEVMLQFEKLFKLHFKSLCYYAMSIVRDEESARDIVHDVFLNLWKRRETLDFSRPMQAYLTVLVRNQCFNYLEHLKVWESYATEELASASLYGDSDSAETDELLETIMHRIDLLPEKCAEVMRLCFIDCKKYKEIAEVLNISVNTVKTHVVTGLRILRDEFSDTLVLLVFARLKKQGSINSFNF